MFTVLAPALAARPRPTISIEVRDDAHAARRARTAIASRRRRARVDVTTLDRTFAD